MGKGTASMGKRSGKKTHIAELGIGTNYNARPTGGMIIVDEKVYGTIHLAIGSNELFGGKNESTIHWDFFKTMGKGSRVYVDGKVLMYLLCELGPDARNCLEKVLRRCFSFESLKKAGSAAY